MGVWEWHSPATINRQPSTINHHSHTPTLPHSHTPTLPHIPDDHLAYLAHPGQQLHGVVARGEGDRRVLLQHLPGGGMPRLRRQPTDDGDPLRGQVDPS